MPVVGLNSLQYFWKARTPAGSAADLARLLEHYLPAWGLDSAIVLGYSQGADVVPFMVGRLPQRLRSRVKVVVIVGTSGGASFDYNFDTFMTGKKPRPDLPVAPEIARLKGTKVMCVYGSREKHSLCRTLGRGVAAPLELNTGHGFAHDNGVLLAGILDAAGLKPTAAKRAGR
jgi:type IV secretory pathway VirJ component